MMNIFEKSAQGQLEAYNEHDIEKFLKWYTEDVKAIDIDTDSVLFVGKEEMRTIYYEKFKNKYLYCKLVNRMVLNRTVIDHEHVTINKDEDMIQAIAIYDIEENGLISTVRFTKGKL